MHKNVKILRDCYLVNLLFMFKGVGRPMNKDCARTRHIAVSDVIGTCLSTDEKTDTSSVSSSVLAQISRYGNCTKVT